MSVQEMKAYIRQYCNAIVCNYCPLRNTHFSCLNPTDEEAIRSNYNKLKKWQKLQEEIDAS